MKKIFSLDRFEGEYAVCISDGGERIEIPRAKIGDLKVHDVFSAELDREELYDITPMPEERDRRIFSAKERLSRLFEKKK